MIDLYNLELEIGYGADGEQIEMSRGEALELIVRLRQAEKDAARYRWLKSNGQLGVGRCGVDWELHFDGPAPDNSAMIEGHIDEAMQCSK